MVNFRGFRYISESLVLTSVNLRTFRAFFRLGPDASHNTRARDARDMCTNSDTMKTNAAMEIQCHRYAEETPKTLDSSDNLLHVLAGWATITPPPSRDDDENEGDEDDGKDGTTPSHSRSSLGSDRAPTTPTAPPPPTEPFPAKSQHHKGRALLNTLLPNLKTSPSTPESSSLSSPSLARIELLIQTLVERVESVERKLDEALTRRDVRHKRDYEVSEDACGDHDDDDNDHFHTSTSQVQSVSKTSSPCLVRASPSPAIVAAFAELYVS